MILNHLKASLKDNLILYHYKLALLFSIIIIPLVSAALINDVIISYSIGISSFVLFAILYNSKLLQKDSVQVENSSKQEIEAEFVIVMKNLQATIKELNEKVSTTEKQIDYYTSSFNQRIAIEDSYLRDIRLKEKKRIADELLFILSVYEDSIKRHHHYTDNLLLFSKKIKSFEPFKYELLLYSDLLQMITEEDRRLNEIRDRLRKYIESYLKENG